MFQVSGYGQELPPKRAKKGNRTILRLADLQVQLAASDGNVERET